MSNKASDFIAAIPEVRKARAEHARYLHTPMAPTTSMVGEPSIEGFTRNQAKNAMLRRVVQYATIMAVRRRIIRCNPSKLVARVKPLTFKVQFYRYTWKKDDGNETLTKRLVATFEIPEHIMAYDPDPEAVHGEA